MRRFFVKNLLFVVAVNLLVKPVWVFLIDRTVQNRVGHEAYGTYQPLLNLCIIFQILLDFGLTYYNTRVISQNPQKLKELFPAMLSARLLLMVVYAVAVFLTGWALGYNIPELLLLSGILLIQAFNSLMLFLRSNVSALHKFRADALLSVLDRLLMSVVCGFLLFSPATASHFKIEWFVWSQVGCYMIAIVIAAIVLRRLSDVRLHFSLDAKEIGRVVKQSLPYATLVFLMAIHMRIDSILVERIGGKDQAGIYAAGYRLLDVGNMFGLMFAGVLLPLFGRMLADKENTAPIVRLSVNMLLPASFIITTIAAYYGTEIMTLLYHDSGRYDGAVFAWLMGAFPAYCMMYVFSTLLTANGNLALLNKIAVAGVVINISLNIWLIQRDLALGAAIATCITQSFLAICYILFSARTFRLNVDIKWLAAHIGFIALAVGTGYSVQFIRAHWIWQMLALAVLCTAYLFAFGFVSVSAIRKLKAQKQA